MSSIENQELGGSQLSDRVVPAEPLSISPLNSTSHRLPCIEDLTVSTRHYSPETTAQQLCKVSMAENTVAGHQAVMTPPSIAQISTTLSESLFTNSRSARLFTHDKSADDGDNQDVNMQVVLYQHPDSDMAQNQRVGAIQMVDQVRKLSVLGNEYPEPADKVVEDNSVTNGLTPIR